MILADTSVWVDHFRGGNITLEGLLNSSQILMHPMVVAELALGSLVDRKQTLADLDMLPQALVARLDEVRQMIETRQLQSQGIGLTDAHLIAAMFLNSPALLWTRDKRLRSVAERFGIHAQLP